jgi:hypothetical protein
MRKTTTKSKVAETDTLHAEYDFSQGIRGKHAKAYHQGHQVTVHQEDGTTIVQNFKLEEGAVILDKDVRKYFKSAEAVNNALRALIELIPAKSLRSRM